MGSGHCTGNISSFTGSGIMTEVACGAIMMMFFAPYS